jgi:hypothetical protein
MADEMAGRIAAAGSSGSMGRVRSLLEVGVAPIDDSSLDEVTTRRGANPMALGKVKAMLEAGPAGAVEDVDALVAIGLPRDLPGGLARVAIHSNPVSAFAIPASFAAAAVAAAALPRALPSSPLGCPGHTLAGTRGALCVSLLPH